MKLKIKNGSEGQVSLNLRDYQIDICSRVREAFEKHRSVMMQMPTGTGKTVVLAEMVRQYLGSFAVGHCNSYGGRVLIVAHRIELIEQTGEHLERYDIDYGVIAGGKKVKEIKPVMIASIQTLSSKLNSMTACLSPSFIIIDEAHHAVAKTYRQLWDAWPEARFLGLTATPYRLSGEGFTDLFDVLVDSWTVKRFIAEGWLSAFDYYSTRPESDEQKLIDNLKKRGADGDFQMKELHETLDIAPCIERLFESFERFAYDKKGIVYAIDIAHAEHIAESFRGKGVAAYAISSKTPLPERKLLIEGFRKSVFGNGKDYIFEKHSSSDLFEEKSSEFGENHSSSDSSFENSPVPSYPEEGLHLSLLNPLPPQEGKDLKPGRLGLYEQTSSRPQGVARELLTQQSCECLTQYNCDFERKASSVEKHSSSSSLENSIFENSPVPSYPEEGLHRFPLNPLSPQGTGDLKPGRLGLYSQTSSRPFGVARELPTQQSCECLTQQSCDFERKASSVEKHSSSSSLENSIFENSPVPSLATPKSFTLGNDQIHLSLLSLNQDFSPEEGLHRFPLNPLSPQGTGDLKPGRLGLYSQTSSRPFGVARELLTQQSCDCLTQQSCECLCAEGAAARSGSEGRSGAAVYSGAAARSGAEGRSGAASHSIQILVSVDLFSEGFDCPDVEFIQLARPTLSLAKYLQMVGRGLRVHEGKECCTIIDNVGLYRRFGLPSGERNWGMFFEGLKDEKMKGLNFLGLYHNDGSVREEGDAALVKIVGHEGMTARFGELGKAGFERKKKGKVWIWVDTLTGISFERLPVVVDFKGVEMMTDDGLTFYPRIRSKWVDGKSGINRKALETQVGDGFGWMKRYMSLHEPDKVYELQEVMDNGMRVYKDEESKTYFQQDLDCPLVSEEEAGGKNAFMALCDKRLEEWKTKVLERRRNGFLHADVTTGEWSLYGKQVEKDGEFFRIVASESIGGECQQSAEGERWFDGNTGFVYHHRPVVRYRGFVKLVYDGDLVYIMNIHEERFIAYHNWEIRADDGICTIGNKLYLKRNKDGKALWIMKRSGDFQAFVVDEPMTVDDYEKRSQIIDAQMMIINKYGKEIEMKRIKEQDTKTKQFGV